MCMRLTGTRRNMTKKNLLIHLIVITENKWPIQKAQDILQPKLRGQNTVN